MLKLHYCGSAALISLPVAEFTEPRAVPLFLRKALLSFAFPPSHLGN